jgi:signal transduction histidine kinase
VEFSVRDTGIGIPKDSWQSIFERFHQIENFETRSNYGLGLGLYVVKTFSELLGGKVEVESEPGKGSTFTVTLPAEKRLLRLAPALKRAS